MLARNHHANATPSAPANPYEAIIQKLTQEKDGSIQVLPSQSQGGTFNQVKSQQSCRSFIDCYSKEETTNEYYPQTKHPPKSRNQQKRLLSSNRPQRHPQQMQTHDFPPGLTPTKVILTALFIHIKILWGLVKQDS
ncbi:hypothetical protein VP01_6375g1, partial [Puccinia sorghi]